MKVFLSPSSQQANRGSVTGYIEETICNRIADTAEYVLRSQGVDVARNDPDKSYTDHVKLGNSLKPDAYIAIHTNAAADPSASGLHAGCYNPNELARPSTRLTQAIFDELSPVTPSDMDKLVRYRFHEVVYAEAPVAYLEIGFHSNPTEAAWIMASTALIGQKIALGILRFLGIKYQPPAPPMLYRVQAGVFTSRERAGILAQRMRAAGFDAIVREEKAT